MRIGDAATKRVGAFSGGTGSWLAARRVAERHGVSDLTLLFTDTIIEDADLYRFLLEAAADVLGVPHVGRLATLGIFCKHLPPPTRALLPYRKAMLTFLRGEAAKAIPGLAWVADGRTPFEVFRDNRFLGNTRVDLCSRVLKREMADRWLAENRDPADTVVYVGIDWTEEHRFVGSGVKAGLRARKAGQGWTYEAPLCDEPLLTKEHGKKLLAQRGITPPDCTLSRRTTTVRAVVSSRGRAASRRCSRTCPRPTTGGRMVRMTCASTWVRTSPSCATAVVGRPAR